MMFFTYFYLFSVYSGYSFDKVHLGLLEKWGSCTECDLSGATFPANRDYILANLSGANLSGADMSYLMMNGANLSKANLSGANLTGSSLWTSNLSGTNLSNADLSNADLSKANLTGAKVTGTIFSRANLSSTTWINGKKCKTGSKGSCKQ